MIIRKFRDLTELPLNPAIEIIYNSVRALSFYVKYTIISSKLYVSVRTFSICIFE